MRVAVVHDWLTMLAGAERVLLEILDCYPDADLYCVIDCLSDEQRAQLKCRRIQTSFIQRLPFVRSLYRYYLPLMPYAIEQFNMSSYDLIISSSHAVAKGVITGPYQCHVCYVHTPMRYAWDLQHQYLARSRYAKGIRTLFAQYILHKMRMWDTRTSNGVDFFIANSKYISQKIRKVYRRDSSVLYPPIDTTYFTPFENKSEYFLTVSRFICYKMVDLIIKAFANMPDKQLIIIGSGPDNNYLRKIATQNIRILNNQPKNQLRQYMRDAKAFIISSEEDFGILPIEAQACGTPVISYARSGCSEVIRDTEHVNPTGVLFYKQSVDAIVEAVQKFENCCTTIRPENCRDNALQFSSCKFRDNFTSLVDQALKDVDP